MPINIPDSLPARKVLENENIFVMLEQRAKSQDIRPLRIAILNLMPLKISTEIHLMRLLSNSPLQVEIDLVRTSSYHPVNTPAGHLDNFYRKFDEIAEQKYDGMIITGAPVEQMPFEEVKYWDEICSVLSWADTNVTSVLYICWAAQAGLYFHYGIHKHPLEKKMFGVFPHTVINRKPPIVRGFDDTFMAPHSRHTEIRKEDIMKEISLEVLAESEDAGVYIVVANDKGRIFVTGHSEYDPETLKDEYFRDIEKGLSIEIPKNYFKNDNPFGSPDVRWRSHANLLFSNWLNYYVYQETPYDIHDIRKTSDISQH